jgi:hypothetical protein
MGLLIPSRCIDPRYHEGGGVGGCCKILGLSRGGALGEYLNEDGIWDLFTTSCNVFHASWVQ